MIRSNSFEIVCPKLTFNLLTLNSVFIVRPVLLFAKLPTPNNALPVCTNTRPCSGSSGCESSTDVFTISELLL